MVASPSQLRNMLQRLMVSYCRIENKPVVGAQLMTCSMTDANSWTEEVKEEEEKKVEVEEVEEKKVDH